MTHPRALQLPKGLPGFPQLTTAALSGLDDTNPAEDVYAELTDEAGTLRFLLAKPWPFFPNYSFTIDDATQATLALDADARLDEQLEVWVIVRPADDGRYVANLRGPVLINTRTDVTAQAVLSDDQPLAAPLH